MKRRARQVYPSTVGVTGEVFQTGRIVYANNMKDLPSFIQSIDNLTVSVKHVSSILVVPLFGHNDRGPDGAKRPIAILQLVNKADFQQITEYDIVSLAIFLIILVQKKIESLSELLGQSIDNAADHHSVLNVMVGVNERISKLDENWEALDNNSVNVDADVVKAGPGLAKNVGSVYDKLIGNNRVQEKEQLQMQQEMGTTMFKVEKLLK